MRFVRPAVGSPFKLVNCVGGDQRRRGVSNCFDAWVLSTPRLPLLLLSLSLSLSLIKSGV